MFGDPSHPLLLMHLGHLFFHCHILCQGQMTQHRPRESGRTNSPQAKLVQNLIHLLSTPTFLLPSNLYRVSHILHLVLGLLISLLTLQQYISPSLATLSLSFLNYFCFEILFQGRVKYGECIVLVEEG